ncbi:hypothetical protein [Candidatus Galacturonibacter soehngenii]|uniref:hypothetical protein n=1 Tax=Candidatus Galacturonatibacter soehngenii TaxID=2307010 RepID=UPI001785501F|nr:hypothetical protein [Candidatus Galacturonibacter soehngenii]
MVRYLKESTEKEIFLESDAPRRLFFFVLEVIEKGRYADAQNEEFMDRLYYHNN